jgi:hypothetical protein
MSEVIGISFLLYGVAAMILFMLIMMGICFLIMRIFRRGTDCMNGCCRCMGMVCDRKEERES